MKATRVSRGFSLLEVMIAVLVFSLGLLGLAGLLVVSVKTNHSAYLRTQAMFLAQAMADRMRANVPGVWTDAYVASNYPIAGTPSTCSTGCTVAEVATRDQLIWSQSLTDLLPAPAATIGCVRNSATAVSAAAMANRAPYDGLCTVTISWSESNLNQGASAATQTFAWVFQP